MVCPRFRMGEGFSPLDNPLTHHRSWQHRVALSRKGRGRNNEHRATAQSKHPRGKRRNRGGRRLGSSSRMGNHPTVEVQRWQHQRRMLPCAELLFYYPHLPALIAPHAANLVRGANAEIEVRHQLDEDLGSAR
jgi:hypothetical protein